LVFELCTLNLELGTWNFVDSNGKGLSTKHRVQSSKDQSPKSKVQSLAEIVFTWLLVGTVRRNRNREQNTDALSHIKASTTKDLGEARERFLNEPAISVTEETTRSLEAAHRESKSQ
jgi:hypothetical protein